MNNQPPTNPLVQDAADRALAGLVNEAEYKLATSEFDNMCLKQWLEKVTSQRDDETWKKNVLIDQVTRTENQLAQVTSQRDEAIRFVIAFEQCAECQWCIKTAPNTHSDDCPLQAFLARVGKGDQ